MDRSLAVFAIASIMGVSPCSPAWGGTFTIDFDHDAAGASIANLTTVNSQYAAWGIGFSPNAFSGAGWATNTGMRATSTDVAAGYDSKLGNVLHAYNNDWRFENGRPSFRMTFANAINSLSLDVIADTGGRDGFQTFVAFYDQAGVEIGRIDAGAVGGIERLTWSGPAATSVAVAHGDFNDWVAIDNITFTTVPSAATAALFAAAAMCPRRQRQNAQKVD